MAAQVRIGRVLALSPTAQAAAAFTASGTLAVAATPHVPLTVDMTASGALSATLTPSVPLTAAMTGSGTLTAALSLASGAHVRIGRVVARSTGINAARVRIGRVQATVQAAAVGLAKPQVRIGRVTAVVTPGLTSAPSGLLMRLNGAWTGLTLNFRKAGAWVKLTPRSRNGSRWTVLNPVPPATGPGPVPAVAGFTLISADNFAALDTSAWFPYDNSTYGSDGGRVQRYMARNVVVGAGSPGCTGGTSLKLLCKRETVGGNAYTAGMLDSKTAGRLYPLWVRFEARMKIPHGQGLWPAWWLTSRNGASVVEVDLMELFHIQVPGKLTMTLHRAIGLKADGTPNLVKNVSKAHTFFEAPTITPGWHELAVEIVPVSGDPNNFASSVQFRGYVDGVLAWSFIDTQAAWWTANGGDPADPLNRFWNVYIQGCQVDGLYIGSPDGPLGYAHQLNACVAAVSNPGTPPNACVTTVGGYSMQLATFGDPSSTLEFDYHRVRKYTP